MPAFAQINRIVAFLRSERPDGRYFDKPDRRTPAQHQPDHPRAIAPRQAQGAVRAAAVEGAHRHRRGVGGHRRGDRSLLVLLAPRFVCDRGHVHRLTPTRAADSRTRRLALSLPAHALAERSLRQPLLDVADIRVGGGLPQVSRNASPVHKPRQRRKPPSLAHAQRRGRAGARVGVSQDAARLGTHDPASCRVPYGDLLDIPRPDRLLAHPVAALDGRRDGSPSTCRSPAL